MAAGDGLALHALYQRTHRIVFTLIVRIAGDRETAEELMLEVFHDTWRRAGTYEPANGTVLGWLMNRARSKAIDRVRYEERQQSLELEADGGWAPVEETLDRAGLEEP